MAEKGIIIDVGFAPQWKDFLEEIDKELSKLDLDKYLNLDEAFEKQSKEVRNKLKVLKKEIDQAINGVGQDPIKAFNELNKSVKSLSGVVLNMAKAMPDGNKYAQEVNSITGAIDKLENEARGAVNVLEELNSVPSTKLQFKEQLKQIHDFYKDFRDAMSKLENEGIVRKKGGIPFEAKDEDILLSKLKSEYQQFQEINEQIADLTNNSTSSVEEIGRAYMSLAEKIGLINRLSSTMTDLGIGLDIEVETNYKLDDVLEDVNNYVDEVRGYINDAMARLETEFTQKGGFDLAGMFKQKTADNSGKILIPVGIDKQSEKQLLPQVKNLIASIQDQLTEPILVEVQLVSAYQSRGNQKLLGDIQSEIDKIEDGEVTEKLRGLIDKMNKRVENAMLFNINIDSQNATKQLKRFTKEVQEEAKDLQKILTINPEFEITPEIRQKLIDEIEEVKSLYKLAIDVEFNFNSEDLTSELQNLNIVYEAVNKVKEAIDRKSNAFIEEGKKVDFVSDKEQRDLDVVRRWVDKVTDAVKTLSQAFIDTGKIADNVSNQIRQALNTHNNQIIVDLLINGNSDLNVVLKQLKDLKKILNDLPDNIGINLNIEGLQNTNGENFLTTIQDVDIQDFEKLIRTIKKYYDPFTSSPVSGFFESLIDGTKTLNKQEEDLFKKLNLIGKNGQFNFKPMEFGANNFGGFIGTNDLNSVLKAEFSKSDKLLENKLKQAKEAGANIGVILGQYEDNWGKLFSLQSKVEGFDLNIFGADNQKHVIPEFLKATDDQIIKLIRDLKILDQNDIIFDYWGDNLKFDPKNGFGIFDLSMKDVDGNDPWYESNNLQDWINAKRDQLSDAIQYGFTDITQQESNNFFDNVQKIFDQYSNKTIEELNQIISTNASNNDVLNGIQIGIHADTDELVNEIIEKFKNVKIPIHFSIDADEINNLVNNLFNSANLDTNTLVEAINELQDKIKELYSITDLETWKNKYIETIEEIKNKLPKSLLPEGLIEETQNKFDENIDKTINRLNTSLNNLISSGKDSDKLITLLKALRSSLNDFSNDKSSEKIAAFTKNLKSLNTAMKPFTNVQDNTFLSSIKDILSKGEELKTFAEVLKSTKKELKNAKDVLDNQDKSDIGKLNLENYSDVIKQRTLNNIPDIDYHLMSQSLEATADGLVKVTTLIKTANGEYVKYIHTTTDGEEIQQSKIESGTASILKQAQAIERLNAKAQDGESLKRIGEVKPNTPQWEELVNLIKSFGIELSEVTQIIQTVDELGYESFQVFHGDGLRTTLGMNSADILYEKNNLVDLTETTKEFESILKKLPSETKKAFKDDGLATGNLLNDLERILELFQKLINLSNSGMKIDIGKYESQFKDLEQTVSNIFNYNEQSFTKDFVTQLNTARDGFKNIFNQVISGTADMNELRDSVNQVEQAFAGLKDKSNILADPKGIANQLKTVKTELFKNGSMDKEYRVLLEQYRDELESALTLYSEGREKEANLTKQRLAEIVAGVMDVQGKIQESGKTGLTVLNKIGQAIKTNFVQYVARYLSLQDIIRYIRTSVEEVKNLDTALTELRKVSDETTERLQVSFSKSAETAKELGNTLSYVINITADWSRLGFTIDEAEELARVTTLFKNVGDNMSADDASSYMISTLQGFQITAEKSEEIVDKFNEVANNYAIDTRGIGEALQRSAASFNAANTSLSGAIAVVTTANEVVQNPEMVGTAMKTLSARIRGSKVELEELGDEEANVVDLTSKLRSEVKAMTGFDIMLDEDTYKSIDEIIIGIGEHWDELTDIQQAALAEDLAGKRNSNVMIALLQNAEKVKDVYKTAEESAGSAQREQENYAKSILYSIDRVKATWSEMIANILKSQDVKKLIDTSADALAKLGDTAEKLSAPLANIMKLLGMIANALATIISIGDGIPAIGIAGGLGAKKLYDNFSGKEKGKSSNIFQKIFNSKNNNIDDVAEDIAQDFSENLIEDIAEESIGDKVKKELADQMSGKIFSKQGLAQALKSYDPHEKNSAMKLVSQLASFNEDSINEALNATDLITSQKNSIKNAIEKYVEEHKDDAQFAGFWEDFIDEETEEGMEKLYGFFDELGLAEEKLEEGSEKASLFSKAGIAVQKAWKKAGEALGLTSLQLGALTVAITASIAAIGYLIYKYNELNVTVADIDSEIDEVNSKIGDLKSRIQELEDIGYRNSQENAKLAALRQELDLQEKILEVEEKRRAHELTEDNSIFYFDKDNLSDRYEYDFGESAKVSEMSGSAGVWRAIKSLKEYKEYGDTVGDLSDKINEELNEYKTAVDQISQGIDATEEKDNSVEKLNEYLLDLSKANTAYIDGINQLEDVLNSEYASRADKNKAQDLLNKYKAAQKEIQTIIDDAQKDMGEYDYSTAIQGMLDNVDGLENKLVELYQQGELNADNIYDIIDQKIVKALEDAEIEASDVLALIQNIADPDKLWRDQTKNQLYKQLKNVEGTAFNQSRVNYLFDQAGIDLENKDHLQAYLDVQANFGDERTKYWTLDKWIEEIQKELSQSDLEVSIESPTLKDLMKRNTGKTEEDKDKTFGDDIDNYSSKISTLEGYLDKLQDGTYTDTDLLELSKEFGITASSVDQLKVRIAELGQEELDKLNEQIEEYKKEAEENGDTELAKGLEEIQKASKAVYDQMVETNDVLKQNKDIRSDIWGSKAGMDQLSAIYKDIKDGAEFDWSSIVNNNEFRENFKRFGKEYEDFINGVFAHPKNIKANQEAFNDLADSYLKAEHILDGLNESEKEQSKRLLDSIGVINSTEMIKAEQTSQIIDQAFKQAQATQEVTQHNVEMAKSEQYKEETIYTSLRTEEAEIASLFKLGGALENATQAEKAYYLEKHLASIVDFTSNDVKQLKVIVDALGLGTDAWESYYNSRARLADVEAQFKAGKINSTAYIKMTEGIKSQLNSEMEGYKSEISDIASSYLFGGDPADAGTEAADAYLEAFNKELGELDALKDAGIISEKEYLERLRALYVKYFADKKKYYQQFKQYEKQYLEGLKGLYESAISASITILNDSKEEIEKQKDETIKSLEEQRDSEKKTIQESIDGLEDEKEALEKANEEREKAMNLQKAQYELERAHSQRTRLIYKNGQMQYVNDSAAVRDAKNNVDDLLRQRAVDELDDKIDDLNKKLEEVEDHYTKLIEETEKMYDEQIQGVQNLIDMWEKLQHQAELVEVYEALGNFGITAQDILSGNIAIFNQIKDGYTGVFAGLSDDVGAVAQAFGTTADQAIVFKNALLGYDAATQAFSDMDVKLKDVGYAAEEAARAIGDDNDFQTTSGGISAVGATEKLGTTVASVTDDAITRFNNWHNTITSCAEDLETLANQVAKMNMPKYDANGFKLNTNFRGTAYANGNWSAKSKGTYGTSLVGELGTELVVDGKTGQWRTVGNKGAEFTHIKANDIVFNHKQTEDLLKNGKINSRGKAYASGNNNKFTSLSPEELSKYTKLSFTADLAEKLDFGNQKLMNIDKAVSTISNNKTVNNNPVINVNNPTFTCTGVNSEQVVAEIQAAFTGLFSNAYQRSMTTK